MAQRMGRMEDSQGEISENGFVNPNNKSSRPGSSGSRGHVITPDKPVLGLSGGSDALRRIMRQLTRDSMMDNDLAELEVEDEYLSDEVESDVEENKLEDPDEKSDRNSDSGHGHMHDGKYLSCKRYPWICLKSNCTHKKDFCGQYKALPNKNLKSAKPKDSAT